MKLTSMQFDGDGGYDTPMNAGATASSAVQDSDDGAARRAAAAGREASAAKTATAMTPTPGIPGDDAHKGIMARSNAMSPMTQAEPAAKAKAPKAIDKSKWDRSIKVSQSTVDAVKDAGRGNMGKAPQRTVKNDAIGLSSKGYVGSQMQYNAPVSAEYKEAVKRVYPNEVKTPKSPSFNESSPNAKAYPKVAAPKSSKADIRKAENAEIAQANKKAPLQDRVAASITNSIKAYPSLVGLSGTTPKNYQIQGTQTKTQKAQAAAKADRAKAVAKNKNK
jgi:hypothetical protein